MDMTQANESPTDDQKNSKVSTSLHFTTLTQDLFMLVFTSDELAQQCLHFQRQESQEWISFIVEFELGDDDAVLLGRALNGSRFPILHLRVGPMMSLRGAQALAEGFAHSSLSLISLKGDAMMKHECKRVLYQGIRSSRLDEESPTDAINVTDLCQCLSENSTISNLTFHLTPSFTIRAAKAFARNISQSFLTKITISYDEDNDDPVRNFKTLRRLCQGIRKVKNLQELEFNYFNFDQPNILPSLLRSLQSLQTLSLTNYRCLLSINESLRLSSSSLTTLELQQGLLSENDMRNLSIGLSNTSITTLDLRGNKVTDAGVQAFVEHWAEDSPIKVLYLGNNYIRHQGALLLLRAVNEHSALALLNLSGNSLGSDGLSLIGEELPNLAIAELSLRYCNGSDVLFPDVILSDAEKTARTRAEHSLVNGIISNHFLQRLDVGGNGLTQVDSEIEFYCGLNRFGRRLLFMDHGFPSSAWCHVLSKCSTHDYLYYFLREQPHLIVQAQRSVSLVPNAEQAIVGLSTIFDKINLNTGSEHSLVNGIISNHVLQRLDVGGNGLTQVDSEIEFYCGLNRFGRRLVLMDHGLPSSAWCHVLSKCSTHDYLYYFLREQPHLIVQAQRSISLVPNAEQAIQAVGHSAIFGKINLNTGGYWITIMLAITIVATVVVACCPCFQLW